MVDYTDSMPTDAILVLIDKLRGKQVELSLALKAAWNIAGYAMSQIVKEGKPVVKSDDPRTDSDDADLLQSIVAMYSVPTGETVSRAMVPWAVLLRIAIKVLMSVLA